MSQLIDQLTAAIEVTEEALNGEAGRMSVRSELEEHLKFLLRKQREDI